MRVTRLEVFGFKSFMERLVLPLDCGITGVVGPNGCGKSNIVDALRWVLGETRARSLRGGVLEDVIFNGTDNLRPLGLAEVTITVRASGNNFFDDVVSPDLEAELAAEQAMRLAEEEALAEENKEEAEVKEEAIVEPPVEEQGDERPQLTVISGSLDESKEEVDKEQSLEEPQQEDSEAPAEEKNTASATLLNRFSWLKAANEVQVTRRLYRSGESEYFINRVACRLKDLKEFFRAIGIGARAHTIVAQGEVSRIVTAKPEERRLILEEAAGVLGFRDKIQTASRRLEDTSVNISRLEDIIKEVTRQTNSLRRQASKARNRQKVKDRIEELDRFLYRDSFLDLNKRRETFEQELGELKGTEGSIDAKQQKVQSEEQAARSDLMSIDVEGDRLRNHIDAIKEEINNRSQQRTERKSRVNELKAFALSRGTEIKRLEEREKVLQRRKDESLAEITRLEQEDNSLQETIGSLSANDDSELKNIAAELSAQRDELKIKESELRSLRDRLVRGQGQLETLKKQLIAVSPLSQLQNTIGDAASEFLSSVDSNVSLFIEALKVPEEYVKALQAVLAEKAAFLVADQPFEIAKSFLNEVLEKDQENSKGLGLGVLKSGRGVEQENNPQVPYPTLLSKINVEEKASFAANAILSRVYVVDSLEEAIEFFEANPGLTNISFVSKAGDLVTDYSFYSLRHEGGIIDLKNQVEQLQDLCDQWESEQEYLQSQKEVILECILEAEQRHEEALKESQARQAKVRELSKEQGSIRGRLQSERRAVAQVEQDLERTRQLIEEAHRKIKQFEDEQVQVEEEIAALMSVDESSLHEKLREYEAEYAKLDENRKERRLYLADLAQEVERVRREVDGMRAKESTLTLELQKQNLEIEHLQEKVLTNYGPEAWDACKDLSNLEGTLEAEQKQEYQAENAKLKARIAREGDVDPTSIERFEEEKQRLDDLSSQKKDLESAATTLNKTIERLRKTSEQRFLQTFEQVKENFSKLVPRLFGGGKASLELLDPNHPLDSGVSIIARPPGKRLKSIDLLSGGEKALCATALIFAMFMVSPSPLCVLDEVDAPLDDANLLRFLSLVKEMSTKTQFLLITHNKQSMAVSHELVGVTMEEPGASKILSVSLKEAYDQVA